MEHTSPNCVFCGIIAGKVPAYRIYEDEMALAFLDINPIAKGHTLVVPQRHIPLWTDMTAEETGAVFNAARIVSNRLMELFNPEFVIPFARGRRVPHTHIFLLPSFKGDLLDSFFTLMESVAVSSPELAAMRQPAQMQDVARIIKEQQISK